MAPAVQLTKPRIIMQGATSKNLFEYRFPVSLPFNITLYNTSSNIIYAQKQGVSICH